MNLKIISHRGLLNGLNNSLENTPEQILKTIDTGFDVEVDLRAIEGNLYLGHDAPDYKVNISFFNDKMWIHCKNLEAVNIMSKTNLNWFWHDSDKLTLTSKGYIWCYPEIYIQNGITVVKQKPQQIQNNIFGICTDYPLQWKKYMELK